MSKTISPTIEEQLASAQADLASSVKELESAKAEHKKLAAERDTLKAKVAYLTAAQASAVKERDEFKAKSEILETEAKSAEARALEIVASIGHQAAAAQPAGEPAGKSESLIEQYAAISDPQEKTAFFRKHKAQLIAEDRKAKASK